MKKLSAAIVAIVFACVFQNALAQTAPAKKTDTVSSSSATTPSATNPVQPASTPDWLKSDADKKYHPTFLSTPAASDTTKTKQKQKRK